MSDKKKDIFDRINLTDLFDRIDVSDIFDKLKLSPEEQIVFSSEMKTLLEEELSKKISSLPVGQIISQVLEKQLASYEKKEEIEKQQIEQEISSTKTELKDDLEKNKKDLQDKFDKLQKELKDKYADLKNTYLNSPRYEFGGFGIPFGLPDALKVLQVSSNGKFLQWGTSGGGSGTVNSGNQYEMAFYDTTGTAVSGDSKIITDVDGNLIIGYPGAGLILREFLIHGTNYIKHQAFLNLTSNSTYTWHAAPLVNSFLQSDSTGDLSWTAIGSGFINNQNTYQTNAEFWIKNGSFQELATIYNKNYSPFSYLQGGSWTDTFQLNMYWHYTIPNDGTDTGRLRISASKNSFSTTTFSSDSSAYIDLIPDVAGGGYGEIDFKIANPSSTQFNLFDNSGSPQFYFSGGDIYLAPNATPYSLILNSDNSFIKFTATTGGTSPTFNLMNSDGTANQGIKTDGAGQLGFADFALKAASSLGAGRVVYTDSSGNLTTISDFTYSDGGTAGLLNVGTSGSFAHAKIRAFSDSDNFTIHAPTSPLFTEYDDSFGNYDVSTTIWYKIYAYLNINGQRTFSIPPLSTSYTTIYSFGEIQIDFTASVDSIDGYKIWRSFDGVNYSTSFDNGNSTEFVDNLDITWSGDDIEDGNPPNPTFTSYYNYYPVTLGTNLYSVYGLAGYFDSRVGIGIIPTHPLHISQPDLQANAITVIRNGYNSADPAAIQVQSDGTSVVGMGTGLAYAGATIEGGGPNQFGCLRMGGTRVSTGDYLGVFEFQDNASGGDKRVGMILGQAGSGAGKGTITFYTNDGSFRQAMSISENGRVGIFMAPTTATARLHIAAGSTSASTAPLKFTSGSVLTTPEAGAVEFDGTNYYMTV